ncbi:MAG: FHA domain-containing protein [Anaerolineales bacterium]|nr:FHA domain-containing protein [Anaerolineales bacterium]
MGILPTARGQGTNSLYLHELETTSGANNDPIAGFTLRATFSLLDPSGAALKSEIEQAQLRLGDEIYTGAVARVEGEWSVVLLVDTSGVMGNARATTDFIAMRDSLRRSLGQAPNNTSFALIAFNDRAPTLQEFTKDRQLMEQRVRSLQAQAGKPSCLNDGLYEAIVKLQNAPGRRAVLVFTASSDNCATRTAQSVIDFARQNRVQIYGVGLQGYTITRQELSAITRATGGLETLVPANQVTFGFDGFLAVLDNQWVGTWTLYPSAGPQSAELRVTLNDQSVVTLPNVTFVSDRAYVRPPSVAVRGSEIGRRTIRFNLEVGNRAQIQQLAATLENVATGQTVITESFTDFADSINLPAQALARGAEYRLTLAAVDAQGRTLARSEPYKFRYEPPEVSLAIAAATAPTLADPTLVVTLTAQNVDEGLSYRVWLEREGSNAPLPEFEASGPARANWRFPAEQLTSGVYVVKAEVLDEANRSLAQADPLRLAYQSPGTLDRLVFSLRQSPGILAGLAAIAVFALAGLGVLVWFLLPKGGARVKTVEMALPEKARRGPAAETPSMVASPAPKPASSPSAPPAPKPQPVQPVSPVPKSATSPSASPALKPQPMQPPPKPAPSPVERPLQRQQSPTVKAPPTVPLVAYLDLVQPPTVQFSAEVRRTPFRVGRRADNDGVIPVDGSMGVSGHHFTLLYQDGQWFVLDEKSTYGTTVNGQTVPKGQPYRLPDEAMLGLGMYVKVKFSTRR